jgi:hypothetical protein
VTAFWAAVRRERRWSAYIRNVGTCSYVQAERTQRRAAREESVDGRAIFLSSSIHLSPNEKHMRIVTVGNSIFTRVVVDLRSSTSRLYATSA